MYRFLLLSCSQRKNLASGLLPAIERYDGPAFQVLRKYCKTDNANLPLTYILSAEYALIPADRPIELYDRKMTPDRASELQPVVKQQLNEIISKQATLIDDALISLSGNYLSALGITENTIDISPIKLWTDKTNIDSMPQAHGRIGRRMATLYDWLYQAPPPSTISFPTTQEASFRGVELSLNANEIMKIASEMVKSDPIGAVRYESWYVPLGEKRIAPKWLLSIITGVPVSQFRTLDARRVLSQLGIEIKRL